MGRGTGIISTALGGSGFPAQADIACASLGEDEFANEHPASSVVEGDVELRSYVGERGLANENEWSAFLFQEIMRRQSECRTAQEETQRLYFWFESLETQGVGNYDDLRALINEAQMTLDAIEGKERLTARLLREIEVVSAARALISVHF